MPIYLYGLLLALSLIWGASFLFIKLLIESYSPFTVAFLRCVFGALTLLIIMLLKKEKINFRSLPWLPLIAVGLFNSAIPWTLIPYSEAHISTSLASVLNASTPIWTLILGILIFKLSTNVFQWIGIALGFIGILVLMDMNWTAIYSQDALPILAMIAVTLCYGFASQLSKRALSGLSVYQISFMTLLIAAISTGSIALFTEPNSLAHVFEAKTFLSLIGLGTFGSGIAYLIFFHLIQKGSAEFATLVTYLVPPFAIIWGVLLLNEAISSTLIIGLLIILSGVFISSRKKRQRSSPKTQLLQDQHEKVGNMN